MESLLTFLLWSSAPSVALDGLGVFYSNFYENSTGISTRVPPRILFVHSLKTQAWLLFRLTFNAFTLAREFALMESTASSNMAKTTNVTCAPSVTPFASHLTKSHVESAHSCPVEKIHVKIHATRNAHSATSACTENYASRTTTMNVLSAKFAI